MKRGSCSLLALILTIVFTYANLYAVSLGSEYGTLKSITVYEQSDSGRVRGVTFNQSSARLMNDIDKEGSSSYDFRGRDKEYYDIYISDALGNLDYDKGNFITIDRFREGGASDGAANSIDAVALNFQNGERLWATTVSRYNLGEKITTANSADEWVKDATGTPNAISARLGNQYSSLTVGFATETPPAPEPATILLISGGLLTIVGFKKKK